MANAGTTEQTSSAATTGSVMGLGYGYIWGTGKRHAYYQLQNAASKYLDYTRIGFWLLGEGEWDGCNELWINDQLVWTTENQDASQFHFHRGCDAIIGSGLNPASSGPDQGVDSFWREFPPAINRLALNRIAYYAIRRKQPIPNQTNTHQDDASQWTDINPIGLWRGLRCRIFNDSGAMSGYAFTTNPAWHWVDLLLRRKLLPDHLIDLNKGAEDLGAVVRSRFDWGSIAESAAYYDEILANGRRRFTGSYYFANATTLNAVLEQILLVCRSRMQEYAGKYYLICDKPRPSVFTFSREHVMPGALEISDQQLHQAPNRFVAKFRDLLCPTAAVIASIACPDRKNPVVTTQETHPFTNGDRVVIGGTGTIYDGTWTVKSVPDGDNVNTLVLVAKGSSYPTAVGAGGRMGLLYSRFKERAPQYDHIRHQLARGAVGLNLPRQRNKVKQELDFSVCTFDQASRVVKYERQRTLGADAAPYLPPSLLSLRAPYFAKDKNGNLAASIQPGDRVTIDDTASFTYAGEYEVVDPLAVHPHTTTATDNGDSLISSPSADGGEIELSLLPYEEDRFVDESDETEAGWTNVPDSDPGISAAAISQIALADGEAAFYTGMLATGETFDVPSGYNTADLLAWAGPHDTQNVDHPMHGIEKCEVDANRTGTLSYRDFEGHRWYGDLNFAALTWRSPSTADPTVIGTMSYVELTLAGGQKIVFGRGLVPANTNFALPAGYTADKMFAIALPHDGLNEDHLCKGIECWVDGLTVHCDFRGGDDSHIAWGGTACVLLVAWQDGAVTTEAIGGGSWMHCVLANGTTFGVGLARVTSGSKLQLPASAGDGSTLQAIASPRSYDYYDPIGDVHPAGVNCYLEDDLTVVLTYPRNDQVKAGDAIVFGLYCAPGGGIVVVVNITPVSASVLPGGSVQFLANVKGTSNTAVSWSVDGIAGGNATVGTIDANGLYTAPSADGMHIITATSQADATASDSVTVSVFSSTPTWIVDES